jgi:hypothetical protein
MCDSVFGSILTACHNRPMRPQHYPARTPRRTARFRSKLMVKGYGAGFIAGRSRVNNEAAAWAFAADSIVE